MLSVIKPKTPKGKQWQRGPATPPELTLGYEGRFWALPDQGFIVISAVEVAGDPDDFDKGPEYHISISKHGGRCPGNEAKWICRQFDMIDAEEDNHIPGGFVRNFWKPVAERLIGHECPCKETEPAMVEDGGDFIWRGV